MPQRGLRVLIDLVVNHTSNEHPWFQAARKDPQVEVSRLVCVVEKEAEERQHQEWCFPGVQKSTWDYDEVAKAYYFHRFYDFQPDLNTANPEVQRRDSENHGLLAAARRVRISHGCGPICHRKERRGPEETAESSTTCCATFSQFLTWRQGDAIILAEANVLPGTDMEYFGKEGERLQMMFNFEVNQNLFYALASGDTRPMVKAMKATRKRPASAQWGSFLRNHDELDLGRLEDGAERELFLRRLGPNRTCSCMAEEFADALRLCFKEIAGDWNLPTA